MNRRAQLARQLARSARPAVRDTVLDLFGARKCRRLAQRLLGRSGLLMRKDAAMLLHCALEAGRRALATAHHAPPR